MISSDNTCTKMTMENEGVGVPETVPLSPPDDRSRSGDRKGNTSILLWAHAGYKGEIRSFEPRPELALT
ncbi:MAG: hypothetical protein ACYCTV_05940 [Leptospirales bacterium]